MIMVANAAEDVGRRGAADGTRTGAAVRSSTRGLDNCPEQRTRPVDAGVSAGLGG